MNHSPHHIGDFNNATRHLTRVERSLYRDLIELYYDTEQPLISDVQKLARRIICDESDLGSLREVLNEFFVLHENGFHNDRCDRELAKYHGLLEQASRAGKASAQQRANRKATPVERPLEFCSTNQNQEPRTNIPVVPKRDDGLFDRFYESYPRQTAKQNARKAWDKLRLTADDPRIDAMRHGLAVAKQSRQWLEEKGRYVPHAATWLNGQRWTDEMPAANVIPIGGMETVTQSAKVAL